MALITKADIIRITSGRGFSELQITDSDIAVCERKYLRDLVLGKPLYNEIVSEHITPQPTGYGYLYNKAAVDSINGIAPTGWHVPTSTEIDVLIAYVGSTNAGKLKSVKTQPVALGWKHPNTGATDEYGLGLLAGGCLSPDTEAFNFLTENGYFWLSNQITGDDYCMNIQYNSSTIAYDDVLTGFGASIRLIKDDPSDWYDGMTMTDPSGNVYPTCKIGEQVWMAANYMSTKYKDTTNISESPGISEFATNAFGQFIAYNELDSNVGVIDYSPYNDFETLYIRPLLAWAVFTHILDRIQVEVMDRGMFQLGAQNAQTISRADIEAFKASIRENLNSYMEETRQYVIDRVEANDVLYKGFYTVDSEETAKDVSFVVNSNTKKTYHV